MVGFTGQVELGEGVSADDVQDVEEREVESQQDDAQQRDAENLEAAGHLPTHVTSQVQPVRPNMTLGKHRFIRTRVTHQLPELLAVDPQTTRVDELLPLRRRQRQQEALPLQHDSY